MNRILDRQEGPSAIFLRHARVLPSNLYYNPAPRSTFSSFGSQMWREAFQAISNDVERLSQDVNNEVADDPLASIGMALKAPPKEKSPNTSLGAGSLGAKRRRKEDQEKEAAAAAALDPFARRRTRPKSYWSVGNELESSTAEVGCARIRAWRCWAEIFGERMCRLVSCFSWPRVSRRAERRCCGV